MPSLCTWLKLSTSVRAPATFAEAVEIAVRVGCCREFWVPKASSTEEEYEDARRWWPRPKSNIDGLRRRLFRFAVADGATASSYSRLWAQLLTRGFVTGGLSDSRLEQSLARLRRRWGHGVPKAFLPWYAEQKLEKGAFAALVGLELEEKPTQEPGSHIWRAWAVGDSCLMHVQKRVLKMSFPLDRAECFGSTPVLLATDPQANAEVVPERASGTALPGDRFYLMTDALAHWFLREHESGLEPWFELDSFVDDREAKPFREWVDAQRQAGRMRNDDVTLLLIELER